MSGIDVITCLQNTYGQQIAILPGGGVSEDNAAELLQKTGCTQLHMTAKTALLDTEPFFAVSALRIRRILNSL